MTTHRNLGSSDHKSGCSLLVKLAILVLGFNHAPSIAEELGYGLGFTNYVIDFSNPNNNTRRSNLDLYLQPALGTGGNFNYFRTTGSAITWNYADGFNAADIALHANNIQTYKNWGATNGSFWGTSYLDPTQLDTLKTLYTGPYAYTVSIGSGGTPGLASDLRNLDLYRGGYGGYVTATLGNSLTRSNITMMGSTSTNSASSIVTPDGSVLYFNSTGGNGGATNSGYWMDAGAGGNVWVKIFSHDIRVSNDGGSGIWSAITATSLGGDGGMCCVYALGANGAPDTSAPATLPVMGMTGQTYQGYGITQGGVGSMVSKYGRNGSAGWVAVDLTDTNIIGTGSRLVGISAASLGGAREVPGNLPGSGRWDREESRAQYIDRWYVDWYFDPKKMFYPGSGSDVRVSLANSSINLTGSQDLVGIYAQSGSKPFYLLRNVYQFDGSIPSAGHVTVNVDEKSSISVAASNMNSGLNIGISAASTGGYAVNAMPLQRNPGLSHDVGYGGPVSITHKGNLKVSGATSIGILGVSAAGGTSSGGSQGNTFSGADASSITVDQYGTVAVSGSRAVGLAAISVGSGGLVHDVTSGSFVNGSTENATNSAIYAAYVKNGSVTEQRYPQLFNLVINDTPPSADGAAVTVNNYSTGKISVGNSDGTSQIALGVVAQSVGSAGGLVMGPGKWFHGSSGGAGGNGGAVSVMNAGLVSTIANRNVKDGAYSGAVGILAQSVGGGGGVGGSSKGLFVSVGGSGGAGGSGGNVTIDSSQSTSKVVTSGDYAAGIIGQSIGGGGGHGGGAAALQFLPSLPAVTVGGQGGGGGSGGNVTATVGGRFTTTGEQSHGLLLQSVGGGGGTGGAAHSGSLGVGFATAVALGGKGNVAGNGGTVNASLGAGSQIMTYANDSSAVILQSIGGGGGTGGSATAKSVAIGLGTFDPELDEIPSFTANFSLGGKAGSGGAGGQVGFDFAGKILTRGGRSHGVMGQSIGGGGGSGGDASAVSTTVGTASSQVSANLSLGNAGGAGGKGGSVSLTVGNTTTPEVFIATVGSGAMAMFGQSIGGGGGESGVGAGFSMSASLQPDIYGGAVFGNEWGSGAKATEKLANDDHTKLASKKEDDVLSRRATSGSTLSDTSNTQLEDDVSSSRGTMGSELGTMFPKNPESPTQRNDLKQPDPDTTKWSAFQCLKKVVYTGSVTSVAKSTDGCGVDPKADAKTSARSVSLAVQVGANGGSGGDGGDVTTILRQATLSTIGSGSHAMFAQSIGGGGGNASTAGAQASGSQLNVSITIGGSGGSGSKGGSVTMTNDGGRIVTGMLYNADNLLNKYHKTFTAPVAVGGESHGMFGQSIGGGGGSAGNADPSASGGSYQWLLDLLQGNYETGALTAMGVPSGVISDLSSGVAFLKTVFFPSTFQLSFSPSISIGGSGGAAGDGGSVIMTNNGAITTYGHRSVGVWGQSIGGGGGSGSAASSALVDLAGSLTFSGFNFAPSLNLGGSGGSGGSGGAITMNSNANSLVITRGYASYGYLAQSIGGGGGVVHEGSTFGLSAQFDPTSNLVVSGGVDFGNGLSSATYSAQAASAQTSGTIRFGSQGSGTAYGNSGSGGSIAMGSSVSPMLGSVSTHGDDAMALFAQSIGGGGGLATLGCSNSNPANANHYASACWGNTTVSGSAGQSAQFSSFAGAKGVNISVNGGNSTSASTNTSAGTINVYSGQTIETFGARSMGIVTQGITGGGGFFSARNDQINSVTMPTQQRATNNSPGATSINLNASSITTHGDGAWGIFSQMVQGGGGFFGDSTKDLAFNVKYDQYSTAATDVFAAGAGAAPNQTSISQVVNTAYLPKAATLDTWVSNPLTVNLSGTTITTWGKNAHGIVLQNLGSVGGAWSANGKLNMGITLVGSNQQGNSPGGNISLNMTNSSIVTYGTGSRGVVIQSDGAGPGGNANQGQVSVNLISSSIVSNSTPLTIVGGSFHSPNVVSIGNGSLLQNSSARANPSISATDTTDASYNQWAIYAPTGYTNVTNNGVIYGNILLGIVTRGDFVNNGVWYGRTAYTANNSLHNYGIIYAGDVGSTGGLYIDGSLKHYKGAEIHVDFDALGSGATSDLITVTDLARIEGKIIPRAKSLLPGSYKILNAGTLEHSGSAQSTHVFDWALSQNGNTLSASPIANFTPNGHVLNDTQQSLAGYLQKHWNVGSAAHAKLFAYIHEHDVGSHIDYRNTLNQLSGQVLNNQAIQMKTSFATSLSDSLSCPTTTPLGIDLNKANCVWARVSGDLANQTANDNNSGYRATSGGIRLGAQKELGNQWKTGFSVGFANNNMTSNGLTSSGTFYDASISLQKKIQQWSLGSSFAVAQGEFNNNRSLLLGGNGIAESLAANYKSKSSMSIFGLRLRAAYEFEQDKFYLKPYADVDFLYNNRSGFSESGGLLALNGKSNSQFNVVVTPMVEFGVSTVTDSRYYVKGYASVGASFLPNNNVSTPMNFANGFASAGSFNVVTDGPSILGRLNLGIQIMDTNNFQVRAEYGLQAGSGYTNQTISANFVYLF